LPDKQVPNASSLRSLRCSTRAAGFKAGPGPRGQKQTSLRRSRGRPPPPPFARPCSPAGRAHHALGPSHLVAVGSLLVADVAGEALAAAGCWRPGQSQLARSVRVRSSSLGVARLLPAAHAGGARLKRVCSYTCAPAGEAQPAVRVAVVLAGPHERQRRPYHHRRRPPVAAAPLAAAPLPARAGAGDAAWPRAGRRLWDERHRGDDEVQLLVAVRAVAGGGDAHLDAAQRDGCAAVGALQSDRDRRGPVVLTMAASAGVQPLGDSARARYLGNSARAQPLSNRSICLARAHVRKRWPYIAQCSPEAAPAAGPDAHLRAK
jgi:hypothetical protein